MRALRAARIMKALLNGSDGGAQSHYREFLVRHEEMAVIQSSRQSGERPACRSAKDAAN